jgi:polysaccharide biosynthesis transport protein
MQTPNAAATMSAANASTPTSSWAASAPTGDMISLGALWQGIKAHKRWIILPTFLALIGSAIAVNLVTTRYTGETRILLETRDSYYTRPGQEQPGSGQIDTEAVTSQVQVMMSRDLAREAIRKLGLVGNSEFDSGIGITQSLKRLLVLVGVIRHPADRTPEDRVLEKYYERLLIFPVARSRIVAIEFSSKDAELAAKAANVIAQTYLDMQESAKKDTARSASTWLSSNIEPLRKKVADAESRVEEYRARSGLLIGTNNTTITSQQLADISGQLASARTAQADSQAKARLLRDAIRTGRTFEVPDVVNNDLIRRLIEQRVTLKTQMALESRTLLPEHPRIKELNAQLLDLEGQLRASAERTVRILENDSRIAGSRVESLTAAIDSQKRNVADGNEAEVQLRALEREAKTLRDQLEQYMVRYREAIARDAQNAMPADARVVSRAITPDTPTFPKKLPIIMASTIGTMMVMLLAVTSRVFLGGQGPGQGGQSPAGDTSGVRVGRGRGRSAAPAAAAGMAASATQDNTDAAPQADDNAEPPVANPVSSERIAGLLTHSGRMSRLLVDTGKPADIASDIDSWIGASGPRAAPLLLVSAAGPDLPAKLIARSLAEVKRTVLVDLSESSSVRRPGLSELLSGDAGFADVIERDGNSHLHVITVGQAGRKAVLQAPELIELTVEALAEAYESVLLLVEPGLSTADLDDVIRHVDGALVLAGSAGNGHAVEVGYRLESAFDGPIALVLNADGATPADHRNEVYASAAL